VTPAQLGIGWSAVVALQLIDDARTRLYIEMSSSINDRTSFTGSRVRARC
jgi:hypothetical protein